jgi:hypothetical protein
MQNYRNKLQKFKNIVRGLKMLFDLHRSPENIYQYTKDGRLPVPEERINKTLNPLDDFILCPDQKGLIEPINTAHVILRGSSFNPKNISKLEGTIFLLNWKDKVDLPNIYYATGDQNDVLSYVKKDLSPILYVQSSKLDKHNFHIDSEKKLGIDKVFLNSQNKYLKIGTLSNNPMPDMGSSLCVIPAIAHLSQNLEIYGWDHYLSYSAANKSYIERLLSLLFGCPNYNTLPISNIIRAIYNFHYGYRFSTLPNITNYGYTADLASPKTVAGSRIHEIFCKIFHT